MEHLIIIVQIYRFSWNLDQVHSDLVEENPAYRCLSHWALREWQRLTAHVHIFMILPLPFLFDNSYPFNSLSSSLQYKHQKVKGRIMISFLVISAW